MRSWRVGLQITMWATAWLVGSALAASGLKGDLNGDGKVDRADAQLILQKSVSSVVLGSAEAALADVNGDGQVNALDAILVLKGTAEEQPAGSDGFQASARFTAGRVSVNLQFDGLLKQIDAGVQVRLLNLAGAVLETRVLTLEEVAGTRRGEVSFVLSSVTQHSGLIDYVIEVVGQVNGNTFRQRRSLYQITPAMAAHLFGSTRFYAGARERIRIVAEELGSRAPVPGAAVQVSLLHGGLPGPVRLYEGVTDHRGISEASLQIPAALNGDGKLSVRIESAIGGQVLEQTVRFEEGFATLLTTDKPLYQPGQTIHIRTLTLAKPGMTPPAGKEIAIIVADSKGNKVFKEVQKINEYGIAAAKFTLANELNLGAYTVSAAVEARQVQKQVNVKRYSLPKFKVTIEPEKPYYLPGTRLSGTVAANYFFGKPVSGAVVTLTASKFDVGFTEFAKVTGTTDAQGNFTFNFTLPTHFVGQPLQQGDAFVLLDLSVTDSAAHTEKITRNVSVAASDLVVLALPESGRLISGVENKIYLLTTYPNNTPARTRCAVLVGGQTIATVATDESGIGVVRLIPSGASELNMSVQALDTKGNAVQKSFTFALGKVSESLLLRTDRTLYSVGDEVLVDIFTGTVGGSIFVDVIKEGQTIYSRSLDPEGGRTSVVIPVSQEMTGAISISAYRLTIGSDTVRDRKIVYVDPANELKLSYEPNKSTYLPGEDAVIRLKVSDDQGRPVAAAVGLNIVDESVFALQEMQPGMEKVYFYLEEQLRKPRYEVHEFDAETIIRELDSEELFAARDQALAMMFASVNKQDVATFELSSRRTDRESLNTKLVAAVWSDIGLLIEPLRSSFGTYSADRPSTFFDTLIQEAVRNGKVNTDSATDPWGTAYRMRYQRAMDTYFFDSAGIDQRWSTADDIAISVPRWMVQAVPFQKEAFWRFDKEVEGWASSGGFVLAPVAAPPSLGTDSSGVAGPAGNAGTPYLRQFFPETLYSNPAVITGPDGIAELNVKMADSITSWRLTGLASSRSGQLGSSTGAVRVFQEFFVDLDVPPTLTRGDEVSVPVAIYNYLPASQDIRLVIEKAPWFELTRPAEKTVRVEANQVTVAYFPIKAAKVGRQKLQVTAFGSSRSDAIAREVEIVPDGSEVLVSHSGRLAGTIEHKITVPDSAIEGGSKILVKIYPGLFSQVVEGLDSLLRMPFGCFEQTSSVTYPNVLALHYMKTTGQITPEIRMKAEGFISIGYQRLLSFEVAGGGFEWFGNTPAHNVLTTYGLMEFSDMSKVWYVDPEVIWRTQQWLVRDQKPNGSWVPTKGGISEGAINRYQNDVLRTTAYVVWGLSDSGYSGPSVNSGTGYVKAQLSNSQLKPELYTLAICAHALLVNPDDPLLRRLFEEFEARRQTQGDQIWWKGDAPTFTFSEGKGADVELTALLAQAYLRYGSHPETAAKALNYLISSKDAQGNFGSTQATVLALKAFAMAAAGVTRAPSATVRIAINQTEVKRLELNDQNRDLLFLLDLQQQTRVGDNAVSISLEGTGSSLYQIIGRYYAPWKLTPEPVEEPITIDVSYDKTELNTRDTVTCKVKIANNRSAKAKMIVIDLGIPPGFTVQTDDLDKLVGSKFQKYQLAGRQAIFYLEELARELPVEFSFRLSAKYPIRAMTPQSVVYEYYNPEVRSVAEPQQLAVSE